MKNAIPLSSFFFPKSLLLVLAMLWSQWAAASPIDTIQVKQQYQQATKYLAQKQIQPARVLALKALSGLATLQTNSPHLTLPFYLLLGDCALELSNFTQALNYYQKSQALLPDNGPSSALLQAEVFNKLGNYYNEIKDSPQARKYLEQALALRKAELGATHLKVADVYNNLGNCWNEMGDFTRALEYHREALAIRKAQLTSPHPMIAQSYNNIGMSLADQGSLDEALNAYQEAYEQYSKYYQDMNQQIADVYINIGDVYSLKEQLVFFKNYQERALSIYKQTLDANHPTLAISYNNLANVYRRQGDFTTAKQYDQLALEIRKNNYGDTHPDVAESLNNMAWNAGFEGQWEAAKKCFDACFHALNFDPSAEDKFDEVNDPQILLTALEGMAYVSSGTTASEPTTTQLQHSLQHLEQASSLIDFLRIRYDAINSKLKLAERAYPIYDQAIQVALGLYQLTKDTSYLPQAWQFSEKNKGLLLLEALKKTQAENFAGVPTERIKAVKQMESRIGNLEKTRFLVQANKDTIDQHVIDSINHQIFESKRQLAKRINLLKQDYPEYFNLRYQTATVPVKWIQEELLQTDQCLLEYFIGESQLFLFVICKDNFVVKAIDLPANFYQWIYVFQEAIRRYPKVKSDELTQIIEQYVRAAYLLQQMLIAPVQDLLSPNLIIIPDGELGLLPFGALLLDEPENPQAFSTHPYLIRQHSVSYNYSATLLKEMSERNHQFKLKPYVGFAPLFSEVDGLKALKYNQEEILAIQHEIGGQVYTGELATKAQFLAEQAAYRVIHLATHASANNQSGDYSWLAFSPSSQPTSDESFLYVKDIYNTPTRAAMVILSACETGTGKMQRGEGITSIARSFSYAGAESLMATLWSVDDRATNQLVQLLFSHLQNGQSKDQALQAAKLNFIEANGHNKAHPYYWSSMINIGKTEALYSGFPRWVFILGGLVLVMMAGIWFWKTIFPKKR